MESILNWFYNEICILMNKNLKSIIDVTDFLIKNDVSGAKEIINVHYPHKFISYDKKSYPPLKN